MFTKDYLYPGASVTGVQWRTNKTELSWIYFGVIIGIKSVQKHINS